MSHWAVPNLTYYEWDPNYRYSYYSTSFDIVFSPGINNIEEDPKFINPASGNFHLRPESPCIDAGDPNIVDADSTRSDMGAYGGDNCPLDKEAPAKIDNLIVSDLELDGKVKLDWSGYDEAAQGDVAYYQVYHTTSVFEDIYGIPAVHTIPAGTNECIIENLVNGTEYFIAVTAVDSTGNEDPEVIAASLIPTDKIAPEQVTTLIVSDPGISEVLNLSWSGYDTSKLDDLAGFNIYQNIEPFDDVTDLSPLVSVYKSRSNYQVTGLENNQQYYFAVTAYDKEGGVNYSSEDWVAGDWKYYRNDSSETWLYDVNVNIDIIERANHPGKVNGAILTEDRFINENNAYKMTNDYIDISPPFNPMFNNQITMMAWIKWDGTYGYILTKGNDYIGNSYGIGVNTDGPFIMTAHSPKGTIWAKDLSNNLKVNKWHHITGVVDGSESRIYLDGILRGTAANIGNINESSNSIWIGGQDRQYYNYLFNGSIDDVKIYNRVLSDSEIDEEYNLSAVTSITDINSEGLVAYYPFNGNANDESVNRDGIYYDFRLTSGRLISKLKYDEEQDHFFGDYYTPENGFYYDSVIFNIVDKDNLIVQGINNDDISGHILERFEYKTDNSYNENKSVQSVLGIPTDKVPPVPVTVLTAKDTKVGGEVLLDWSEYLTVAPTDLYEFKVYQSTAPFINVDNLSPIAELDKIISKYYVRNLLVDNTYYFAVTAMDNSGNENSTVNCVNVVPTADGIPPVQITTLTVQNKGTGNTVVLDWSGYDETGQGDVEWYKIYRSDSSFTGTESLSPVALVKSGTFTKDLGDLTDGQIYYFAVTAIDGRNNEENAVIPVSGISSDIIPPQPVSGFSTKAGNAVVELSWINPNDSDLTGVKIERSPQSPEHQLPVIFEGMSNLYIDTTVANGTTYTYSIKTYDEVPNYSSAIMVEATPTSPQFNAAENTGPENEGYGVYSLSLDYDSDGDEDILLVNGGMYNGTSILYHNLGNLMFADSTEASGINGYGFGNGAAAGDIDNDGDRDIYLTFNGGINKLYRNDNGIFTNITTSSGTGYSGESQQAVFTDLDNDGDLDIYLVVWGGRNIVYLNNGSGVYQTANGNKWDSLKEPVYRDRKSTRLNSSHIPLSRMPSSA